MSENTQNAALSVFDEYQQDNTDRKAEVLSLQEYILLCKTDKGAYATAAERLLTAMGEPVEFDTHQDPRLSRIFSNRKIMRYPAFDDFFGAEETVMKVVNHLRSAAQGLEEKRQVLYLLGPVGGGKSSVAERLKELMQKEPIYVLQYTGENGVERSPITESPLALIREVFKARGKEAQLTTEFGIQPRRLKVPMSPWALKRLEEANGDLSKFSVVKLYPSISKQIAISKTEPGDENNQDISALVGKVDIRKLEEFPQDDTDAYGYSGGLCQANQGLMEFVEMFKAPIKVLHPLLTATQEGNFKGTESIGNIPFDGLILAHSNESEWNTFKNNKNNEAFLDRVNIIKIPYTLRVSEEAKIYDKMLKGSELSAAPCAPKTLEMAAEWSVLTRLVQPEDNASMAGLVTKMKVYDGVEMSEQDKKAHTIKEYQEEALDKEEGMSGSSTRFMFKTLSHVFNLTAGHSNGEISADPLKLMNVLEARIIEEQLPKAIEDKYLGVINEHMRPSYFYYLQEEIKDAFMANSKEFGQHVFDRYVLHADMWIQGSDYLDPDTGIRYDKTALDGELAKLEKPAGIVNGKDFRNEIVNFVLRARSKNNGANPDWTSYEKFKVVIEKKLNANMSDLLPVISFGKQKNKEDDQRHADFVAGMVARGYTEKQVRTVSEWYDKMAPKMAPKPR